MQTSKPLDRFLPDRSFVFVAIWLTVLWVAGGASRADAVGQVLTRAAAWGLLIALILFQRQRELRPPASVTIFVAAAILLALFQLIPLPPAVWLSLPGRSIFAEAAVLSGQAQPWRPLSISPPATMNALSSLIVPLVTLLLLAPLKEGERWRTLAILLCLVVASSFVGLLQFSGVHFNHPLLNDVPGMVSASFANRNHFALFSAIGCLLTPVWALQGPRAARWKAPTALALILLFGLIILATGSRVGVLLGVIGVALGLLIVRQRAWAEFTRLPKPVAIAVLVITVIFVISIFVLSVMFDRAISLDRMLALEAGEDLRNQALPVVVNIVAKYFPFGAGIGAFDAVYRIDEPFALLDPLYFNHAHNDLLEVALEGGLFGLSLLTAAVLWWLWRTVVVWKASADQGSLLPRAGSGIMFLVFIASAWDYPARTPMIMAVTVIAAVWLAHGHGTPDRNVR